MTRWCCDANQFCLFINVCHSSRTSRLTLLSSHLSVAASSPSPSSTLSAQYPLPTSLFLSVVLAPPPSPPHIAPSAHNRDTLPNHPTPRSNFQPPPPPLLLFPLPLSPSSSFFLFLPLPLSLFACHSSPASLSPTTPPQSPCAHLFS